MFNYDIEGPMAAILEKSALRKALLTEWPSLSVEDISAIKTEADLVETVGAKTGRTPAEAKQVVRNWMERHRLPPMDEKANDLLQSANENWENEGGPRPPRPKRGHPRYRRSGTYL